MAKTQRELYKVKETGRETLIDLLPFEMHVPGYKFYGPGTKLAERQ